MSFEIKYSNAYQLQLAQLEMVSMAKNQYHWYSFNNHSLYCWSDSEPYIYPNNQLT